MCPHCRAFITTNDKVCPYCDAQVGTRAIDRRMPDPIMGGLIPADRFVTMLLLMVNSALFVASLVVSGANGGSLMGIDSRTLVEFGANYYPYVQFGQYWRLITAGFLHISVIHVAVNMWSLFAIGAQVEEIYGASRMTAIWIISTFTGFWASFYFNHGLSAGASAGLFGLIGAMIALGVMHKANAFAQAAKSAYLQTAVINLAIGFMGIFPVDNWAHMGGLAGGFVVAMAAGVDHKDGSTRDRLWFGVATVCLLVTLYCFWKAVRFYVTR